MELPLLLRRTHRIAIGGSVKIFFVTGALALAGCADTPSAYNPIDWAKSASNEVSGWFSRKPGVSTQGVEPPPAEGRPYPNLGTVPKPPPRPTPEVQEQRARERAALEADRQAALTADNALRTTGSMPAAASATPPPTPDPGPPAGASRAAAPVPPPAPPPPTLTPPVAPIVPVTPAAAAAPLTFKQRIGHASFMRDGSLTAPSLGALQVAAKQALAGAGRVHLVPAEIALDRGAPERDDQRVQAVRQTLERAGLPANRVVVDADLGLRVGIYDIYVER